MSSDEQTRCLAALPVTVRQALERSIDSLTAFHRVQVPADVSVETVPGVFVERRWSPLRRVAAYVPGQAGRLPSTPLMTVVPARIAGVDEVVVSSPAGPDGAMSPVLLAAASLRSRSTSCTPWAVPKRWRRSHTAPGPSSGWTRSSGRATPG